MPNPKVFISHASKDKERFVTGFARGLRAKGIDAWVDEWEMNPGDSLVDKIFEEGIGQAQALIVVLSKNSTESAWVREELNAGVVQRVAEKTRLIPVLIEDCEIPIALRSTLYIKVNDFKHVDDAIEKVVATVFGVNAKPTVGPAPGYVGSKVADVPGLNRIDSIVLKLACEEAIHEGDFFINSADIWLHAQELGLPEQEFYDSIRVLHENGFFGESLETTPKIQSFSVTLRGFHEYAKAYRETLDAELKDVAFRIVNDSMTSSEGIIAATGLPETIVRYALDLFNSQGWIQSSGSIGGVIYIGSVSPQLKRQLLD